MSADSATQGADNSPDNTFTMTLATSNSALSPQDDPHVGSGTTGQGQTGMLSTEKALDEADQAVNGIQLTPGMIVTTANVITTASDVIDNGDSVYQTWVKAVATMQAVMVAVDKIAEVIIINLSAYP